MLKEGTKVQLVAKDPISSAKKYHQTNKVGHCIFPLQGTLKHGECSRDVIFSKNEHEIQHTSAYKQKKEEEDPNLPITPLGCSRNV